MGRGRRKTLSASRAESNLYLAKGTQFLEEAMTAVREQRHDAAMLNAIHSGISAADAIAVALAGRRSADPDHQRAVDLLEDVLPIPEPKHVEQLRLLLAAKNAMEYESRRATAKEATDAVKRASRVVEWARTLIAKASP
jgi:hypothetical protein